LWRVTIGDELRRPLVADWWRAGDRDGAVMTAHRRHDVADLNGRARALLRAADALRGPELTIGDTAVAAGDRVLMRRNDRRLGVVNGERGVVVAVDVDRHVLAVELRRRTVRLDRRYLETPGRRGDPAVSLGYAITGHAAQGLTCSRTFVLATDGLSKEWEWAYVALSRGRDANRLYVTGEQRERLEYAPAEAGEQTLADDLRAGLARSDAQQLATDGSAAAGLLAVADELHAAQAALEAARSRESALARRRRSRWFRRAVRDEEEPSAGVAALVVVAAAERVDALRREREALRRELDAERRLVAPTIQRQRGIERSPEWRIER
jgi:hypothetical protein